MSYRDPIGKTLDELAADAARDVAETRATLVAARERCRAARAEFTSAVALDALTALALLIGAALSPYAALFAFVVALAIWMRAGEAYRELALRKRQTLIALGEWRQAMRTESRLCAARILASVEPVEGASHDAREVRR